MLFVRQVGYNIRVAALSCIRYHFLCCFSVVLTTKCFLCASSLLLLVPFVVGFSPCSLVDGIIVCTTVVVCDISGSVLFCRGQQQSFVLRTI